MLKTIGQGSVSELLRVVVVGVHYIVWFLLGLFAITLVAALLGAFSPDGKLFNLPVDIADWRVLGPAFALGIVHMIAAIIVTGQLRGVLDTLVSGDPFVASNAPRLRMIGFTVAILELARYAIQLATLSAIAAFGQPDEGALSAEFRISFTAWGMVLVLFVLAQVFDEGTRLRDEEKMTI
jgi:uncharacterized membrane protein YuzA (DUF378 family)